MITQTFIASCGCRIIYNLHVGSANGRPIHEVAVADHRCAPTVVDGEFLSEDNDDPPHFGPTTLAIECGEVGSSHRAHAHDGSPDGYSNPGEFGVP